MVPASLVVGSFSRVHWANPPVKTSKSVEDATAFVALSRPEPALDA